MASSLKKTVGAKSARPAKPKSVVEKQKEAVVTKSSKAGVAAKQESKPKKTTDLEAETVEGFVEVEILAENQRFPAFSGSTQSGKFASSSLKGQAYIVFFYPKDNTPGCTTEACGFQEALPEFRQLEIPVIGVSCDSVASHQRFAEKYELNYPLLADETKELSKKVGVYRIKHNYGRSYLGIERTTFLVGSAGKILRVWRKVKVKGHVEEVLKAVQEIQ